MTEIMMLEIDEDGAEKPQRLAVLKRSKCNQIMATSLCLLDDQGNPFCPWCAGEIFKVATKEGAIRFVKVDFEQNDRAIELLAKIPLWKGLPPEKD